MVVATSIRAVVISFRCHYISIHARSYSLVLLHIILLGKFATKGKVGEF